MISPNQLGQQLEKLKTRRVSLETQRVSTEQQNPPVEQVECEVADFCAEAAKNLADFGPERWRAFLQTLIHSIIFFGTAITIQGRVPISTPSPGSDLQIDVSLSSANACGTAAGPVPNMQTKAHA